MSPISNGATADQTPPRRTVLFLTQRVRPRELKMAAALRRSGLRVVVAYIVAHPQAATHFDAAIPITSFDEVLSVIARFDPWIIHSFCKVNEYRIAAELLHRGVPRVVCDFYDVINGMYASNVSDEDRLLEQFCVTRAAGVCARGLELLYLRRHMGICANGPMIHFPDYCWGNIQTRPKQSATDNQLHMVYAGNFGPVLSWFPRTAERLGFHLHIYPDFNEHIYGQSFEQFAASRFQEFAGARFVHIYRPLFDDSFLETLSQYDATTVILDKTAVPSYTPEKFRYAYTNKLPDAIDARLVFLGNRGSLWQRMGRHLGVAPDVDESAIGEPRFWQELYALCRSGTVDFDRAQTRFSIMTHVPRLIAFYSRVAVLEQDRDEWKPPIT